MSRKPQTVLTVMDDLIEQLSISNDQYVVDVGGKFASGVTLVVSGIRYNLNLTVQQP